MIPVSYPSCRSLTTDGGVKRDVSDVTEVGWWLRSRDPCPTRLTYVHGPRGFTVPTGVPIVPLSNPIFCETDSDHEGTQSGDHSLDLSCNLHSGRE